MKVLLSGYNIDAEIIKKLKERSGWDKDNVTPETLSAAYARISRDPRDIGELRKDSRQEIDKARKSNETIIFGLGHGSVAEHAYFNFDIVGLSRYAVEQVQKFRMASFTEKSQRYITLYDDHIVPEEIREAGFEKEFEDTIRVQNEAYHILYEKLREFLFEKHTDLVSSKSGRRTVDGWAKEDARYVVSLSTESQFGMSLNARSLENMIRQFASSSLSEIRELGKKIYEKVKNIAPSIIKYVERTEYDRFNEPELLEMIGELPCKETEKTDPDSVKIVSITPDTDKQIAEYAISCIRDIDLKKAKCVVNSLSETKLKDVVRQLLKYRKAYDSVKRYFEFADATFEMKVSASNFAQLKRHRISTLVPRPYDISLGYTVPENIIRTDQIKIFTEVISKTESVYKKIKKILPVHSQYILTNAHNRKVMLKMNFRELYHFMSLRLDEHAQWDIRNTAELMLKELSFKAPFATVMMCGKNSFDSKRSEIFG